MEDQMYVFNRIRIANPTDLMEARQLAVTIADAATKIVSQPITAFEARFGHPGAISWSTPVADMTALTDLTAKLAADPSFNKLLEKGRTLWSNPDDGLLQIVASNITNSNDEFYASTVATPSAGKLVEAIAYGMKIQEYVAKAGFASLFGSSVFGQYGQVGWLLAAQSAAQLDAWQAFRSSDPKLAKMVDEGGHLFVPGSGVNRLVSRLA
jgi:hypothetical protein